MSNQYRAGRFFPSLHGNLPGDDMHSSLFEGGHVFSAIPRGPAGRVNAISYDPANLTMEDVQWDKST